MSHYRSESLKDLFSHISGRLTSHDFLYEFVFLWQYMSLYSVYYMVLSSYNPTNHSNKVQYESLTHSGTHAIPACSSGSKLMGTCANEANCSQMTERLTMSMKYETFDSRIDTHVRRERAQQTFIMTMHSISQCSVICRFDHM